MKEKLNFVIIYLGLHLFIVGNLPMLAQTLDPNARDLILLTKWFEGEFDNDSQNWYEGRMRIEEKHDRLHAIHTRISAPDIGKHVFYVEEYTEGDSTKVGRQRIVSFISNAPEETMEMELYFLKDPKKYLGAYGNPEVFNGFKKEDLFELDGCNIFFKRVGEQYRGGMKEKACQFGKDELRRYSVHDMVISENQYWRVDRTFLTKNDKFHKGHPNEIPHKMRRAEYYSCNIAFHEKAYYAPTEKDKKYNNVLIHNQGSVKTFYNPIKKKNYTIQLREKQYPFYEKDSDFFMMRFKEEGELASKAIIISEPGVKKTGFQMGWASCLCEKVEKK